MAAIRNHLTFALITLCYVAPAKQRQILQLPLSAEADSVQVQLYKLVGKYVRTHKLEQRGLFQYGKKEYASYVLGDDAAKLDLYTRDDMFGVLLDVTGERRDENPLELTTDNEASIDAEANSGVVAPTLFTVLENDFNKLRIFGQSNVEQITSDTETTYRLKDDEAELTVTKNIASGKFTVAFRKTAAPDSQGD